MTDDLDDDLDDDDEPWSHEQNPREWWQHDTADWIDLERQRCAAILAACIRCHRPTLALKWIAAGTSVDDVMMALIGELAHTTSSKPASDEFDEVCHIFASLDVSRAAYVTARLFEKARAKRRGWC